MASSRRISARIPVKLLTRYSLLFERRTAMAQPARAIDPFTLRQIRIHEERVMVLLWNIGIECGKLKRKVAQFRKDVLAEVCKSTGSSRSSPPVWVTPGAQGAQLACAHVSARLQLWA